MRYEVAQIGSGWGGTAQTVSKINQLIQAAVTDPVVIRAARSIVRNVPERDKMAEVRAVSDFVRSKIRYTSEAVETLSTPRLLLDEIRRHGRATGDCDEFVLLWGSLLRVLGHPIRAVTISQRPDQKANHIYGQVFIKGRGWVTDDTIIKRKPLGWEIPKRKLTKKKVFHLGGVSGMGDYDGGSDMDPLNPYDVTVEEEGGPGVLGDWIQVGRTPVVQAQKLAPRKRAMQSRRLTPSAYAMKRPGMIYVGHDGGMEGVTGLGQWQAITDAAKALIPTAVDLYKTYRESRKRPTVSIPAALPTPKALTAPIAPPVPPPPPAKVSPILYIALAVGAIFLLSRR